MPNLSGLLEKARKQLEGKQRLHFAPEFALNTDGSEVCSNYYEPDSAYAPLLAVVREPTCGDCHPDDFTTRTAYWEAADKGALWGSLQIAWAKGLLDTRLLVKLNQLRGDWIEGMIPDIDAAALEALVVWLKIGSVAERRSMKEQVPSDILETLHPSKTETLPKLTPLDHLAEHYGPNGTVLNTDDPVFQALWEWSGGYTDFKNNVTHPGRYARCSYAEVAERLPEVIGGFQYFTFWKGGRVTCELFSDDAEPVGEGHANKWLDALCAAILAKEGVV